MKDFVIDPDIRRASSLPSDVYTSDEWFARVRDRVLARTWHMVADEADVASPGRVLPRDLLAGSLDEPLLLTRDAAGALHCLSNVCTHRGNLVAHEPCETQGLRCRYHGRRFALDGRFVSMPEFDGVERFPSPADDLARIPHARLDRFVFASLDPAMPFDEVASPVREVAARAHLGEAKFDASRSRDYEVRANWALYCDNYLEGFHIPFVHAALATAVDYGSYRTELHPWGTLQVAYERDERTPDRAQTTDAFESTPSRIAAHYFFLFPTTMLNFYPWGLSVNLVRPIAPDRTAISFRTYVRDSSKIARGAGADLHRVEMEDEAVVESVQRGVRARAYDRGRYSPARETGVHHFHRLLARLAMEQSVRSA